MRARRTPGLSLRRVNGCGPYAVIASFALGVFSPIEGQERVRAWIEGPSGPMAVTVRRSGDVATFEGDIRVEEIPDPTVPSFGGRRGARSAARVSKLWPNGVVPYVVSPSLPNRQRVTDAIAHFHSKTNLRFVSRSNEANYVEFVPSDVCRSYVGRKIGRQTIELAPNCNAGSAIHEIGHAVGLWHEQSRLDRDNYVIIYWSNIAADEEDNFAKYSDGQDLGPY